MMLAAIRLHAGADWQCVGLLLILLFGLLVPAYPYPSLIALPTGNQQPANPGRQTAPVQQSVILAYRYDDPARSGTYWYACCGGDPVNHKDPTGLDDIEADGEDVYWASEDQWHWYTAGIDVDQRRVNIGTRSVDAFGTLASDSGPLYEDAVTLDAA
jgi:hypothetical protein